MLTKRIIPCLDIKNGRTVKGTNFIDLRDAGDPVDLAQKYSDTGADELVFLDIAATQENRSTLIDLVKRVGQAVNIPFSVGGGISDVSTAYNLLQNGADKISINSSAVRNPELITELSRQFGEQCVIVAIDAKFHNGKWMVYTHGGTKPTEFKLLDWAKEAQKRGAGEILFTSMDHDGTKNGFACEMLRTLNQEINIPIIASGGAGSMEHFLDLFSISDVSAALAASIFHYQEVAIPSLKTYLNQNNINVRI
jgi:imidazole glycerol-phosphate synthase subunit HisF